MEYLITNKGREILLTCENGRMKSYEDLEVLSFKLDKEVTFDIKLNGLRVKLENEELVFYSEDNEYFKMQSPVIKCGNIESKDCAFNIENKEDKLYFTFSCKEEECTKEHDVNVIINKVNENNNVNTIEVHGNNTNENKNLDVVYNFETKEVLVRKKAVRFVEKLINYCGYNIEYSNFKEIIYRERECTNENEVIIKNLYDSFVYLISDYKTIMSEYRLRRFFYLVLGEEIKNEIVNRIVSKSFEYRNKETILKISSLFKFIWNILSDLEQNTKKIISFMLLNYLFVLENIPVSVFYYRDYEFFDSIDMNDDDKIKEFILGTINKNEYQERKYYFELDELEYSNIKDTILYDKEILMDEYKVKHISVFGSFSHNKQRIDSDIDLLIQFSLDITSEKLMDAKEKIKSIYQGKLNRFIDIMEINEFQSDEVRLETKYAREIF